MSHKSEAPPVKGGTPRNLLGRWLLSLITGAALRAQPPAIPPLIALHLGADAIAEPALGSASHG